MQSLKAVIAVAVLSAGVGYVLGRVTASPAALPPSEELVKTIQEEVRRTVREELERPRPNQGPSRRALRLNPEQKQAAMRALERLTAKAEEALAWSRQDGERARRLLQRLEEADAEQVQERLKAVLSGVTPEEGAWQP